MPPHATHAEQASSPQPEAGPSCQTIDIPSTGLEYWEYRRACFLAGQPWPGPRTRSPSDPDHSPQLPSTYHAVSQPPQPAPSVLYAPAPNSSVGRLEALLSEFGAEESDIAWNGGVGGVARNLGGGKRLAKGLRLGLVIKVLRAGWLRDGTWPLDPLTSRAVTAPDSPEAPATTRAPPLPPAASTASYFALPVSSRTTPGAAAYTGMPSLADEAATMPPPPSTGTPVLERVESPPRDQLVPIPVRAGVSASHQHA